MVEAVFHIGAHKCASTAIQRGLAALAPGRPDLLYVPPSRPNTPAVAAEATPELTAFCRFVRRKPDGQTRASVADGLCRLLERHSDRERVVFSEEMMLGAMPGLAWSFYPRAHLVRGVIDAVAARFPTSTLLLSREPYGYLRSCHRFRVRYGMTMSFMAMLERFDLETLSWLKLGETLFEGAAYRWRLTPLEALRDPDQAGATAETLDFLVPGWGRDGGALEIVNPANAPLLHAATLVLGRVGVALDTKPRGRFAAMVARLDAETADLEPKEANARIAAAFAKAGVDLSPQVAALVRAEAAEERVQGGSLRALLTERFAPDYAKFLRRYAPGGRRTR